VAGSLKRQRLLIGAGFVIVAVAFGGQVTAVTSYEVFFGAAYTACYGLLAYAAWVWFTSLERERILDSSLATVLSLWSAASVLQTGTRLGPTPTDRTERELLI
jgi:hypothetical protein